MTIASPSPVPTSGEYFFDKGEGIAVIVLIIVGGLWVLCMIGFMAYIWFGHKKLKHKIRNSIAEWLESKGFEPLPVEPEPELSEEE